MTRLLGLAAMVLTLALAWAGPASAYNWPLRPFTKQHPIRGFFGDPRTVYEDGVLAGFERFGFFSFHQGVDISAPDGTPVYPVVSGTAHYLGAAVVRVTASNDRVFQYFHLVPTIADGQQVVAKQTVLGFVEAPFGHVHLTEIDGTHAVNPLQKGHLSPYVDHTRPTIRHVLFRNRAGLPETPRGICGRVEIAVDALDTPPIPVPGSFHGFPVTPALVRWRVTGRHRRLVVPWRTAADFRSTLPPNRRFFRVYAQGTYQNAPRFGRRQYSLLAGRYLFLLAHKFDTASLRNGVYSLTVLTADERGNTTVFHQRFSILNSSNRTCASSLSAASSPAGRPASALPPA